MVQNPPEGYQRVIPYMLYEDGAAALEFLCRAFGAVERFRMPDENGTVMHAELDFAGECVMIATANTEMGMASPKSQRAMSAFVMVYVDDVDAHFATAKAAGANIVMEPETQFYGDRSYRVHDCDGHLWTFATHVKDVAPEDMAPPSEADCTGA